LLTFIKKVGGDSAKRLNGKIRVRVLNKQQSWGRKGMNDFSGVKLFDELCPLDHPDARFRIARRRIDEIIASSFEPELFAGAKPQKTAQPMEQTYLEFENDKTPVARVSEA